VQDEGVPEGFLLGRPFMGEKQRRVNESEQQCQTEKRKGLETLSGDEEKDWAHEYPGNPLQEDCCL